MWTVFSYALGAAQGEAEINVTQSPGLNSFLPIRTDAVDGYWKQGAVIAKEKVQISTLDAALTAAGIDCVQSRVYLKLDTQGFDLEVLKGGVQSLPHLCALQTEASILPLYKHMPTYLESIETMTHYGFALSGMFPVTHDDNLRLVEMDMVFVRQPEAT